jgi:aminoglycoside phosphotransferase (APT) family kinase protein
MKRFQGIQYQQLQQLLKAHGYAPVEISPVTTGKFNETYVCQLREKKVVLRIAPDDTAGFIFYEKNMMAQEPGLHKIIREKTSIPVPEIYVFDDSRTVLERNFLIMEHIRGQALSDIHLSRSAHVRIMERCGRFLRELHDNCTSDKYGYLGEHKCMRPAFDWTSAFQNIWEKLITDVFDCKVYDKTEKHAALQAIDKQLHVFDRKLPASLLHMDIWAQNIMVSDGGNINGIVDWDRALWGDPEIEFAVLDYCGFNNAAFWRGYGKASETSRNGEIRRLFYHLYEVQKYLVIYTLRRHDPKSIHQYKPYCLRLIDNLLRDDDV